MKKVISLERDEERKLVFVKDSHRICVKKFFEARFKNDSEASSLFSDGQTLKPPIPWSYVENLMTSLVPDQLTAFYEMHWDFVDNQTIEILEIGGDRLAFASSKTPSEIMDNEELRFALGIVVFKRLEENMDKEWMINTLKKNGLNVLGNKIVTTSNPYLLSYYNNHFAIQEPAFSFRVNQIKEVNEVLKAVIPEKRHKEFVAKQ